MAKLETKKKNHMNTKLCAVIMAHGLYSIELKSHERGTRKEHGAMDCFETKYTPRVRSHGYRPLSSFYRTISKPALRSGSKRVCALRRGVTFVRRFAPPFNVNPSDGAPKYITSGRTSGRDVPVNARKNRKRGIPCGRCQRRLGEGTCCSNEESRRCLSPRSSGRIGIKRQLTVRNKDQSSHDSHQRPAHCAPKEVVLTVAVPECHRVSQRGAWSPTNFCLTMCLDPWRQTPFRRIFASALDFEF